MQINANARDIKIGQIGTSAKFRPGDYHPASTEERRTSQQVPTGTKPPTHTFLSIVRYWYRCTCERAFVRVRFHTRERARPPVESVMRII